MKLYYTAASQPEALQPKPMLSLGGFKSSSPVPNSVMGNLFGDVSMYTVKNNNANAYIGLVLVNDGTEDAFGVNVWFDHPDESASTFSVAAADMGTDSEGNKFMEHVPSLNSKPLYAEFAEADGEINRVNIGDLPVGGQVGVWIKRSLNIDALKAQQNSIYKQDPLDPYKFLEVKLPKEDTVGIGLSWDLV